MKYIKQLKINDIFYSIQGEGFHTGRPAVFIRFSDCNLRCSFCDTEFLSGKVMSVNEIMDKVKEYSNDAMIVLTGGEPTLYDLEKLTDKLKNLGYYIAIETNGLRPIMAWVNWICVSPKNGYIDIIKVITMDEVKFVIENGDKVPNTDWILGCHHYWISPMNFSAITEPYSTDAIGEKACTRIKDENIKYCVDMVKSFPKWKLNIQTHKVIGVE